MNAHPIVTHVAALAVAAGAAWFARGPVPDAPNPPLVRPAVAPPSEPRVVSAREPLIAVASDGRVTLRVEQQPLEWVIEQIALQAGTHHLRERVWPADAAASASTLALPVSSTRPNTCSEAPVVATADARRLLAAIEHGNEAERLEGLLMAVSNSVDVPDALLQSLLETDASERVRLVALERYLDPRDGDPAALRAALEAALRVPNSAVQQEARRRLDELTASQRPEPSDPRQAPP